MQDNLGKAFPNVSYLDLSNNKIRLLSQYSFQHLTKLHVLHLSYNKLASISQGSFSHLLWLSWLDLRHNRITGINKTKTGWPKRLKYLYLSYNRLRIIPPLPTKASVSLISNPIFCGCDSVVNKKITQTLIKVNCHQLDYFRNSVEKQRVVKYDKYRSSVNTCKPATILKFSSLVVEGQIVLTCVITTFGYPPAAVFIYFEKKVIKTSKDHVILEVTEPGIYTCKVTNYISSDQRAVYIPYLVTTDITSDSEVTITSEFSDHNKTETSNEHVLVSTTTAPYAVENIADDQGMF